MIRGRGQFVPLRAFQVRRKFPSPPITPSFDLEATLVVPALPKGAPLWKPRTVIKTLKKFL